jgi:hypothetical protein
MERIQKSIEVDRPIRSVYNQVRPSRLPSFCRKRRPDFLDGAKEFLSNMTIRDVRPLKHDNGVVGAMAIGHILVRIPVVFLTLTIDKVAKMIFLARFGSGVIVCC